MKFMKNKLKNKTEDEFLTLYLLNYIKSRIVKKFDINSIINEFYNLKKCHAQL